MKRIPLRFLLILSLVGCLLIGASYLHYKGYDRRIARKIIQTFCPQDSPTNWVDDMNYPAIFNDKNDVHLSSAKKLGLKQPLKNRSEIEAVKGSLVKIKSNKRYTIDKLTHSSPYLTKGASELLDMIGQNFLDSLKSKGMKSNKIIVTSVLRTQEDIQKLKKSGNPNASMNSSHCYGTTIDITYVRYAKTSRNTRALKKVLGEVLRDLKKQKKCHVKYEFKQQCFHITTRI